MVTERFALSLFVCFSFKLHVFWRCERCFSWDMWKYRTPLACVCVYFIFLLEYELLLCQRAFSYISKAMISLLRDCVFPVHNLFITQTNTSSQYPFICKFWACLSIVWLFALFVTYHACILTVLVASLGYFTYFSFFAHPPPFLSLTHTHTFTTFLVRTLYFPCIQL